MNAINQNSELRALDDQELDAVSGAATAWEGMKAAVRIMEQTAMIGAAIGIGIANWAIKNGS
jgi:hypothetical protein